MPGSIVVSLNDYSESSNRYSDGMRPVRVMSLHKTCQYSTHGNISFLIALIVVDLPGPVRRCGVGDLAPCGGAPDLSDADLGCVPFSQKDGAVNKSLSKNNKQPNAEARSVAS